MRPIALLLALAPLVLAGATPAAAQDYGVEIAPDSVVIDPEASHAKLRKGRQLVSGQVTLAQPIVDAGRTISRVDVMQEWDCGAGRYRTVRKIFRDDNGLFMHSEPRDTPWTTVAKDSPGWATMKQVCPAQAEAASDPTPTARPGPQVITMPTR